MTNALEAYEREIETYRVSRDVAGKALLSIYEGELWSEAKHTTFEDYCRVRWLFNKSAAYALLDAGRFVLALEDRAPTAAHPTDKQLRALKRIRANGESNSDDWGKRADAWEAISSRHGSDVDPQEIREILTQEKWVPPRSKKFEISAAEKKEREAKALLREVEDALRVLADCKKPVAWFKEQFGDMCLPNLEAAREWTKN